MRSQKINEWVAPKQAREEKNSMSKNDVFLIRENALNILVEAYKKCNGKLRCYNFNNQHFGAGLSEEEFSKCAEYLASIDAIKLTTTPGIINLISAGIEIAEAIIIKQQKPSNQV